MFVEKLCLICLAFSAGLANAKGEDSHSYLDTCPRFHIRKSTIIKTQQSISNGAQFLGKKITTSSRGCHEECCKSNPQGCNLVMIKYSEEKVSCFMFNCRSPSVCSFYTHESYHNYAALEYGDKKRQYSSKNYGTTKQYKDYHKVKLTTTEPPVPTTTESPREVNTVQNWGHVNWFEATTTTKPMYHKWNSWNSDKKKLLDDQDIDKVSTTHHSSNHKTSGTDGDNYWHKDKDAPKTNDGAKYGTYDHTQKDEFPTDRAEPTTEEDFPRRVFVDNNPDFPDEPQSRHKKTTEKPTEAKPVPTKKKASSKTTEGATDVPVTKSRISNVVVRNLNIRDNKAVIPLAIGLVLALLLLMGVIFRLKTSRRRRTKAFLTDDADYLINGMYL